MAAPELVERALSGLLGGSTPAFLLGYLLLMRLGWQLTSI